VTVAIDFNDQLSDGAVEIERVWPERMLLSELQPGRPLPKE
jgi:hypothetical protein